ncbi:MAG: DUF2141 domain-containing protein [Cyclobacteriaceae bacterium]
MDKRKYWILYFLIIGGQFVAVTSSYAQKNSLVVNVKNVNSSVGKIYVALYSSDDNYLKDDALGKSMDALKGSMEIEFSDLPPGEYAVCVIHDLNGNKNLDKNFLGIPKEGFGFIDGIMGNFGPPPFEKAKFFWNGVSAKVEVPLRYL